MMHTQTKNDALVPLTGAENSVSNSWDCYCASFPMVLPIVLLPPPPHQKKKNTTDTTISSALVKFPVYELLITIHQSQFPAPNLHLPYLSPLLKANGLELAPPFICSLQILKINNY